jgi:hypothetical protein
VSGFIVEDMDQAVAAVCQVGDLNRLLVRRAFELRFTVEAMARAYLEIYRDLPDAHTGRLTNALSNGLRPPLRVVGHTMPLGPQAAA